MACPQTDFRHDSDSSDSTSFQSCGWSGVPGATTNEMIHSDFEHVEAIEVRPVDSTIAERWQNRRRGGPNHYYEFTSHMSGQV